MADIITDELKNLMYQLTKQTNKDKKIRGIIDRYLCSCGMVKISKGPGYSIKIASDACGFK